MNEPMRGERVREAQLPASNGMRLLIVTQAVDTQDPILGFFHRWIEEFAAHAESVHVICLKEGAHALPSNVYVHSLGKEVGRSRVKYIFRFYRYIWSLRNQYDAVFVHMNPEYVVLGGLFWKLRKVPVALWFVHRVKNWWLRIATKLVDTIVTSVPDSFTLKRGNVIAIGHGVDVAAYEGLAQKTFDSTNIRLVTLGRISRIKRIEMMLQALSRLRSSGMRASLDIIGEGVMPDDTRYIQELHEEVNGSGLAEGVRFRGSITNDHVPRELNAYDFSINASPKGGIDKTVLESSLAGPLPLTANSAFLQYFGSDAEYIVFTDADDLATKVERLSKSADMPMLRERLRHTVRSSSDVKMLVPRILEALYGSGR